MNKNKRKDYTFSLEILNRLKTLMFNGLTWNSHKKESLETRCRGKLVQTTSDLLQIHEITLFPITKDLLQMYEITLFPITKDNHSQRCEEINKTIVNIRWINQCEHKSTNAIIAAKTMIRVDQEILHTKTSIM